jgi:hypothetical protein
MKKLFDKLTQVIKIKIMKKQLYLLLFILFSPVLQATAPAMRSFFSLVHEYSPFGLNTHVRQLIENRVSDVSSEVTFFKRLKEVASSVIKKQMSAQLTRKMLLPAIVQNNIRLMFDLAFSPFGTALHATHVIKKINSFD